MMQVSSEGVRRKVIKLVSAELRSELQAALKQSSGLSCLSSFGLTGPNLSGVILGDFTSFASRAAGVRSMSKGLVIAAKKVSQSVSGTLYHGLHELLTCAQALLPINCHGDSGTAFATECTPAFVSLFLLFASMPWLPKRISHLPPGLLKEQTAMTQNGELYVVFHLAEPQAQVDNPRNDDTMSTCRWVQPRCLWTATQSQLFESLVQLSCLVDEFLPCSRVLCRGAKFNGVDVVLCDVFLVCLLPTEMLLGHVL